MLQILSVTCDNALPNDMMINALAEELPAFHRGANRTRCFTHILNPVVKVILHQFDGAKDRADEMLKEALHALDNIAGDIEGVEGDDDDLDDDDGEGSADAGDAMSEEEGEDVEVSGRPVQLVLTKVSSNSDTCAGTHMV